jgi:DNA-binding beta-propeller fold protein YncE
MDYYRQNELYVADAVGQSIRKITEGAEVSIVAGDPLIPGFVDGVGTSAKFSSPTGVAVDIKGNIYVADYINNCIRKIVRQ